MKRSQNKENLEKQLQAVQNKIILLKYQEKGILKSLQKLSRDINLEDCIDLPEIQVQDFVE